MLPLEVLEEVQKDLVDYKGMGMSLLEMSHRGPVFEPIIEEARTLALSLWEAPDDFDVLFLQGGASMQFAMTPMNLLSGDQRGAYVNTGHWVKVAIENAQKVGNIYEAWSGAEGGFIRTPTAQEIRIEDNTRYVHICSNETIGGLRYPEFPQLDSSLVADMSSEMLARPIPWNQFDIVYGGAQKNLGPAGVTIVYIRKSILEAANQNLPKTLSYPIQQANHSMANTPPVFSIWMVNRVLHWLKNNGGVRQMELNAAKRAGLIYQAIDSSDGFYHSPIETAHRSHMNIVFRLPNEEMDQAFIAEAAKRDLVGLKGHKVVGGIRASVYNAMPIEGAKALVDFMRDFQQQHG